MAGAVTRLRGALGGGLPDLVQELVLIALADVEVAV